MNSSSEWKRTAMAAPTVSLFSFGMKWKFVWPIQSVLKVHQTLRWMELRHQFSSPSSCILRFIHASCSRASKRMHVAGSFFIITLHQVHVLYMLIDCDNQTCISLNMLKVIILVILHSRFINLSMIFYTTISFNI